MAAERRQPAGGLDQVRRRRRARRLQEKRRRAALRRRNALICAAIASALVGVAVGSGAGGGSTQGRATTVLRPPRGGAGPPRHAGHLVTWTKPFPILMYRVVASPPATAQLPELFVDPETFDAQMNWLKGRGYAAVSLNQVYDAWFKHGRLPEHPVVLTFDDGYRGDYVYARPTLRRLGWPGDLNLLVGNLGSELSDQMVRRLINDGWELDAHTISHLDLTTLTGARLQREISGSRRILQRRFHQPVNFFC